MASGSWDKSIKIWNISNFTEIIDIGNAHERAINKLIMLQNRDYLVSASYDNYIKVWNIFDWTVVADLNATRVVDSVVELSNGSLCSVVNKGTNSDIQVWNFNEKEEFNAGFESTPIILTDSEKPCKSLLVLNDSILATGSQDNTIKLWNLNSRSLITSLKGHSKEVSALVLLDDGRLASGSMDETIKIWKITPEYIELK